MAADMKLLTPENADHAVTPRRMGRYFVDVYSTPTQPQTAVVRDSIGQGCGGGGEAGHHEAGGGGMGAADADYGEGSRRQDGFVWIHVQADELRCGEEVSDCEPCVSGAADGLVRQPRVCGGAQG